MLVIVLKELIQVTDKHQLNKINKILAYPYDYKKRYLLKLYSI